jgi:hypothetical protein
MGNGAKEVVILFCQTQNPPYDHYPNESYHNHSEYIDARNASWDQPGDDAFSVDASEWGTAGKSGGDHPRAAIDRNIG